MPLTLIGRATPQTGHRRRKLVDAVPAEGRHKPASHPVSISSEGLHAPKVDGGGTPQLRIAKLLHLCGLAASTGEATRKLLENAVSINGEKFIGKVLLARSVRRRRNHPAGQENRAYQVDT